jgi:hypothetical protein
VEQLPGIVDLIGAVSGWLLLGFFLYLLRRSLRSGYRLTLFGWGLSTVIISSPVLVSWHLVSELGTGQAPRWLAAAGVLTTIVFLAQMGGLLRGPSMLRLRPEVRRIVEQGYESLIRGYSASDAESAYRWAVRHYEEAFALAPANPGVMKGYAQALYYLARTLDDDTSQELLDRAERLLLDVRGTDKRGEPDPLLPYVREYREWLRGT